MSKRIHLDEPLDGWFGDYAVQLVSLSATGATIRCDEDIPADARALLRFFRDGREIEILAEHSRSGTLSFLDELLRAQEANAMGNRQQNVFGEGTLTAASSRATSTFVTWTHDQHGWTSRESPDRDQPPNGFTVYAGEPDEQVALLRQTWESGDTESRKLTRILAELSVTTRTGSAR